MPKPVSAMAGVFRFLFPRKRLRLTRSHRFTHSRAILEQSPHRGLELLEIDRLRQVGVEAGFLSTLDIFLHAETGERDGWRLPGFSYLPDEVDAGAIGQTQVAEKKIESSRPMASSAVAILGAVFVVKPRFSNNRARARAVSP